MAIWIKTGGDFIYRKNKSRRRIALRAQWKALTRCARRGKNAEALLKRWRQSLLQAAVSFLVDIYPGWVYYYLGKIPQGVMFPARKRLFTPDGACMY